MIDSTSLIPLYPRLNPPGCHSELRHNVEQLRCKCPHHNDFFPHCHSFKCGLFIEHEIKAVRIVFFFFLGLFNFIVQNWQDFHTLMIILPRWPIRIPAVSIRRMGENRVLMIIWHFWNLSVGGLVNWLLEMINTSFFTQHYIIPLQPSVADVGNDGVWNIQQQIQLVAQNSWPTCLVLNDFYVTLYIT